jgi:hypothetical protein
MSISLSVVMPNVIMLNVVTLNVVAPTGLLRQSIHYSCKNVYVICPLLCHCSSEKKIKGPNNSDESSIIQSNWFLLLQVSQSVHLDISPIRQAAEGAYSKYFIFFET